MSDRPRDDARSLVGGLYDTYGASLYRYAVFLLADPVEAEDVVHRVFATVLRQQPRIDRAAAYLRRAVRNECYSTLRGRARDGGGVESGRFIEPVVEGLASDDQLGLERALAALSAEQREVIHQHVFEGQTFKEIADGMDASINTVAARYRYALARLRRLLASP